MSGLRIEVQHQIALNKCVTDARTVGLIFILLGLVGCVAPFVSRAFEAVLFGASSAAMLLVPGVLYTVAGNQLKRRRPHGALLGRWAVLAQLAGIGAGYVLLIFWGNRLGDRVFAIAAPATVSTFLVPALIAFVFSTRRAQRLAREMEVTGNAFAALPAKPDQGPAIAPSQVLSAAPEIPAAQVLPVAPALPPVPASPPIPVQVIVSDRPK